MQQLNINIRTQAINNDLPLIISLKEIITEEYEQLFFAVFVHGSIATDEVIPYSDFDGLLIVKDKFKDSKTLNRFNYNSLKLIYKFDPLQHHGWFVIYENQLQNYPQNYFPFELFEYSKLIFPQKEFAFNINWLDYIDYKAPFRNLSNSIFAKLKSNYAPKNIFQLKGYLSEIMLLPALYLQAKDKKGIYKKFSFDLVKKEFKNEDWYCIDVATKIRANWSYTLNKLQTFFMTQPDWFCRKLTKKWIAPIIPKDIEAMINEQFEVSLKSLIIKMKQRLNAI